MTAPDPTAGEREAACPWCHYGDPHPTFSTCPASPPAVAASMGTSEDMEALAEACWLLDSGDPTWGWENLLPEQQDHHREQVKILAPVFERIVAAREAAARAEERERIARAIEAHADQPARDVYHSEYLAGVSYAARIAREGR